MPRPINEAVRRILISSFVTIATGVLVLCGCTWHPDPRFRSSPYASEPALRPQQFRGEQYGAMDSSTVARFKEEIRLLWQAPYRWGGNSQQGIDCSGLIVKIYRDAAEINLPRTTRELFAVGTDIGSQPLQFADLVFFGLKQHSEPDHVGLYVAHGYFVHASVSAGVKLSNIFDPPYRTHFEGARRIFN